MTSPIEDTPPDTAKNKVSAEASTQGTRKADDEASSKEKPQLASVGQVFSFARTTKTKLQMLGAFFFALISGATFPGESGES